jgi:hypothetical protein
VQPAGTRGCFKTLFLQERGGLQQPNGPFQDPTHAEKVAMLPNRAPSKLVHVLVLRKEMFLASQPASGKRTGWLCACAYEYCLGHAGQASRCSGGGRIRIRCSLSEFSFVMSLFFHTK